MLTNWETQNKYKHIQTIKKGNMWKWIDLNKKHFWIFYNMNIISVFYTCWFSFYTGAFYTFGHFWMACWHLSFRIYSKSIVTAVFVLCFKPKAINTYSLIYCVNMTQWGFVCVCWFYVYDLIHFFLHLWKAIENVQITALYMDSRSVHTNNIETIYLHMMYEWTYIYIIPIYSYVDHMISSILHHSNTQLYLDAEQQETATLCGSHRNTWDIALSNN